MEGTIAVLLPSETIISTNKDSEDRLEILQPSGKTPALPGQCRDIMAQISIGTINAAINKILRSFKQTTYLGITATPFANIFITPDIDDDGAAKDLFPRHFLTLLPTPDDYIGADKIFRNGNTDNWCERIEGQYNSSQAFPLNRQ